MSERVLEILSLQGKAGERGLKGQKVRGPLWAWGWAQHPLRSPPCLLSSFPSPEPSAPAKDRESALPSLNSAPYRVMLGIPETLERREPQGGQDCQESLEFKALWGQKEKRLVRWGGWGQGSLLHKKIRWHTSEGRTAGPAGALTAVRVTEWRLLGASPLLGVSGACFDFPG